MLASSKTAFFVRWWWHGGGQAAFPTRAWRKLIAFPLPNARSDLTFFLCTFGEWSQIIMKRLFKSLWRTSYMEGRKPWWWWWQQCNFESPLGQFRLSTTDCFLCSYPARSKQIDHLHKTIVWSIALKTKENLDLFSEYFFQQNSFEYLWFAALRFCTLSQEVFIFHLPNFM